MFYWSPEWISAPDWGSPWENVSLFDFDNEVLPSIKAFDDNTGIQDILMQGINLSVSPNPLKNSATISFTLEQKSYVKIELLDFSGREISVFTEAKFERGIFETPFNIESLEPGIYLLKLTINEIYFYQKIIKTD